MNYCPNCGTAVAAEQKFCSNCGQVVIGDSTQVNKPNSTNKRSISESVKELFKKKRYRSAAYLIGTTLICFFFANNGVDVFAYIVCLIGFILGMKIWWDALKQLPVTQKGSMIQASPDNRKTLYILMGVFTFFYFSGVYLSIENRLKQYKRQLEEASFPSSPSATVPNGFMEDEFFKNIGLSKEELIRKHGEPFETKRNSESEIVFFESFDWRYAYSIKKGSVRDASKYNLGISPDNLTYSISLLMAELRGAGFTRISDYDNVKRFSDGNYTIAIFPIQTDAGDYNLGLMAFKK